MRLVNSLDFSQHQALNLRLQNLATPPSSPTLGQTYYDTNLNRVRTWGGSSWLEVPTHLHAISDVTNLSQELDTLTQGKADVGMLSSYVPIARTITTGLGLSGGGDLSVNRTLSVTFAASGQSSATAAVRADDSRLSDARTPLSHTHTKSSITDFAHSHLIADLPVAPSGTSNPTQLVRADDSRLSDARTPSGSAGGSLSGSYPNPTIASAVITDGNIAAANKDGAAGTPSMRTLGVGAQQAMAGDKKLNTIGATGDVTLSNFKITNLGTPTSNNDAATKYYVDQAVQGLVGKASVVAATTGPITLGAGPTSTVDGVALAAGDRVLVKNQADANTNGIYVYQTGGYQRAADFDTVEEARSAYVFIEKGTINADSGWLQINDSTTTGALGSVPIAFIQFSSAGAIEAGDGLSKSGQILSVIGTANRIAVTASGVDIASNYAGQTSITTVGTLATGTWNAMTIAVAKGGTGATTAVAARANLGAVGKAAVNIGNGSATSFVVTHSLNTRDVQVVVYENSSPYEQVIADVEHTSVNDVTVRFSVAPAANAYRVVVTG